MAAVEIPAQQSLNEPNIRPRGGRGRRNGGHGTTRTEGEQHANDQELSQQGQVGARAAPRSRKRWPRKKPAQADSSGGSPANPEGHESVAHLTITEEQPMNTSNTENDNGTGSRPPRQRGGRGRNRPGQSHRQTIEPQQLTWQQQMHFDVPSQRQPDLRSHVQAPNPRGPRAGRANRQSQIIPEGSSRPTDPPREARSNTHGPGLSRQFGSQLTTTDELSLHQPAPTEAHPDGHSGHVVTESEGTGEEINLAKRSGKAPSRPQRQQPPKSAGEAEDLMTRIHKGLASGAYECMICYAGVTRKSQIWDCSRCFAVFHLRCITKWAKQGLDTPPPPHAPQNGEEPVKTWRCPGCQNAAQDAPSTYTCWCGKEQNPEVAKFIPPHSCGQTCGKRRPNECPHTCNLQCHAGPCPPCSALGPIQTCYCGKQSTQRRCVDTDYEKGWSCQEPCGDFMPCGEHNCPKPCHSGLCGECQQQEVLKCYCGKNEKDVSCSKKGEPIKSMAKSGNDVIDWMGHWACATSCDRPFDCNIHHCSRECHPADISPAHCPFSPDMVTHCPCGKTKLAEILPSPRQTCKDPIAICGKRCDKTLLCGHNCLELCHSGDCGICLETVQIVCRCGRTTSSSMCHQGCSYEPPLCMRTCKATLNCQRHECGEKCCSGETAAMERMGATKKKKGRSLDSTAPRADEGYEPEHICTRPCGKKLKCGTHSCPMLCHRGPCGTCLEANFEELTCACGRTVIQPPIPCGTPPPPCNFPCTRFKDCPHPAVPHNCHGDEEKCPKCPYLTTKRCVCGRKEIRNQPCWRDVVSCGGMCGMRLSCGSHICKKTCHSTGSCDEPCTQPCGKPRSCGHGCVEACHAPYQCSENSPCQAKIQLTCSCGGLKQEAKCIATKGNPGNKKELKCNDQCRARRLALALDLDPDRDGSQHSYNDSTQKFYMENKQFAQSVEKTLRSFAESPQKRYAFPPMKSSQREFIHLLAEDFGFESESQDPEPYRNVVVFKTSKFLSAPRRTIAEHMQNASKAVAADKLSTPTPHIEQLRKPGKQPSNAILIQGTRVGLLMTDLEKEINPILKVSQLRFTIHWTGDEEVVLQPKASSFGMDEIELELSTLKPSLKRVVAAKGLAQTVELCWISKDGKVVNTSQKWSLVASSSSSSKPMKAMTTGGLSFQNGFNALDPSRGFASSIAKNRSTESLKAKEQKEKEKKKKKDEEEVVDDWETAAEDIAAEDGNAENSTPAQNDTPTPRLSLPTADPSIPHTLLEQ